MAGDVQQQCRAAPEKLRAYCDDDKAVHAFAPDVPSVRFGRRFLRDLQTDFGNLPIVSYSWSQHPKTERWYRLIGYDLYEVDGLRRRFVLQPQLAQP